MNTRTAQLAELIDYTVECDDGAEVYIFAKNKHEAHIDAIERGYAVVSEDSITETPE